MPSNKMKAVICTKYGEPEVLKIQLVDKPIVKKNEILIKIYATAINSGDGVVRSLRGNFFLKIILRFLFGWRKPRNPILGTVYSGIIEQVGKDVIDFKVGEAVFGLVGFRFGAYAEYISVKASSVICKKPINASFEEAAALLFGGQTAHYFLTKSKVSKEHGLKAMIYGATGAVGTAAMQIANYYGAKVTAVCSDYNAALVKKLDAEQVIFYNKIDFTKHDEKYDVIFDAVGKINKKQCAHLLNRKGEFLTVGGLDYAKESLEQITFLKALFESGSYDASIDKIFHMEEVVDAHRYLDSGRKRGNVVLKIVP